MPLQHSWKSVSTELFLVQHLRGCFHASAVFICNQSPVLPGKAGALLRAGGPADQASALTLTNQRRKCESFSTYYSFAHNRFLCSN